MAIEPPPFKYHFTTVKKLIDAWSANMQKKIGWVLVFDEFLSVWTNESMFPGFLFIPRKPWPFGKEFHPMFCCLRRIMLSIAAGGKCRSRQLEDMEYDDQWGKQ